MGERRSRAWWATAIAAASLVACSSSSGSNATDGGTGGDAGGTIADAGGDAAPAPTVVQKGTVVDFLSLVPIQGVTVTLAPGSTGTTDDAGAYAVGIAAGTPYTMTMSAPAHNTVLFGEVTLSADWDFGRYTLSSNEHTVAARGLFTNYDPSKGVVLVSIGRLSTCADIAGTTVAVSPAGNFGVHYFLNRQQSSATSAQSGEDPAAVVWNVEPNVPVAITLTSPTCAQAPAPVTDGPATFAGAFTTQPGGDLSGNAFTTSFTRAYLK